jgi:hypothetical protein
VQKTPPQTGISRPAAVLFYLSMNFLFQISEQFRMETVLDGNFQPITQFFDCRHSSAVISTADDVIDRRLRHTTQRTQPVDTDIPFPAQFQNALFDCFTNVHEQSLPFFSSI